MRTVKYEEMLLFKFEEALQQFPVAYVPVGSLEWHGRHLALGTDSLKAYGILVLTAQKYGGTVVPPTYWGHMNTYGKPCCHLYLDIESAQKILPRILDVLIAYPLYPQPFNRVYYSPDDCVIRFH